MSELIITSSAQAYIINGDSPMTSVANTVAMTTLAVHTLQPLIFRVYSTVTVGSAMYTRCIDSNLESGRYTSRVGRASSFLSLERPPVYLPDGTVAWRYRYNNKALCRALISRRPRYASPSGSR